ncbi:mitogen-activated protein kinase kinase kinase 20-like [Humulus lupulus]|uniref:mitogen-activated protein kinase kinase kinase 20-like n=1 Tax=Humulus lupulus TaxID=3486 RepID=UPI002B409735|nr:mitogen-activated protein kinase kinase kinase 20-like [Humulus lupulus]
MLGKGGYGTVYCAKMIEVPSLVDGTSHLRGFRSLMAVKTSLLSESDELVNEKKILDLFDDCPFIIDCYGDDTTIQYNNDDQQVIFYNVFLEYAAGGTLFDHIETSPLYNESEQVKQYIKSILMGVMCIHEKGFVHCDLKPDNILLVKEKEDDDFYVAKISDFGLAKMADPIKGSSEYMAPECVCEDKFQEQQLDIWAFGTMVLLILTKRRVWSEDLSHYISEEAKDFVLKCLETNPFERPSAKMLLSHPFIADKKIMRN